MKKFTDLLHEAVHPHKVSYIIPEPKEVYKQMDVTLRGIAKEAWGIIKTNGWKANTKSHMSKSGGLANMSVTCTKNFGDDYDYLTFHLWWAEGKKTPEGREWTMWYSIGGNRDGRNVRIESPVDIVNMLSNLQKKATAKTVQP